MKKMFQKTYLEVGRKQARERWGLREKMFWVGQGSREAKRGKLRVFENMSHLLHKTVFRGLGSREISHETH